MQRKNRLFQRINLVDAALVAIIVLLIVILYSRVFPFATYKKLHTLPAQKTLMVEMVVPVEMEWISKYVAKGDQQKGLRVDRIYAEVVDVYYHPELAGERRLVIKLKVLANLEPGQYPLIFGRYSARMGEEIVFQTERYVLKGNISNVEEFRD